MRIEYDNKWKPLSTQKNVGCWSCPGLAMDQVSDRDTEGLSEDQTAFEGSLGEGKRFWRLLEYSKQLEGMGE